MLEMFAFYEDHHPTPDEVYLIIEVADTMERFDRQCELDGG